MSLFDWGLTTQLAGYCAGNVSTCGTGSTDSGIAKSVPAASSEPAQGALSKARMRAADFARILIFPERPAAASR